MNEEEIHTSRVEVGRDTEDETSRTRSGFRPGVAIEEEETTGQTIRQSPSVISVAQDLIVGADPGRHATAYQSLREDANIIRRILPELAHLSDQYLTQHPLNQLQKYVEKTRKENEDREEKDVEARLHKNLERAVAKPIHISHSDNRVNILHPARFLPGPAAT